MTYNIAQPGGAGSAGEGKALDGAWLGLPITISGNPVMTEWQHTILDKPLASSSVMVNAASRVGSFTPDVAGDTYHIRLRERINNGPWLTTTKVVRVTRDNNGELVNLGICSIAFQEVPSEANYGTNTTGYASLHRANNAAIVNAIENRLSVVTKTNGDTLEVAKINLLDDDGSAAPAFVLPDPAAWIGQRCLAKRLGQIADAATLTVDGGALIDGTATYILTGPNVCAELFSDGANILVGPTTGAAANEDLTIETIKPSGFHLAPWNPATLVNVVSGRLQEATDQNGGPYRMTAANAGSRPYLNTTGPKTLNGDPSVEMTYNQGSFGGGFFSSQGGTIGAAPYSLICVSSFTAFDATAFQTLICSGSYVAGTVSWGSWIAASGAGATQDGGGYIRGCTTATDADLLPHVFVSTWDGTLMRFYIDGFLVATHTPSAPWTVDNRNGKIGMYTNDAATYVAAALHFDAQWPMRYMPPEDVALYSRQCAKRWGLFKLGTAVLSGDSITAGNALPDTSKVWGNHLQANLPYTIQPANLGIGGTTIQQIATDAGLIAQFKTYYSAQRQFKPGAIGNLRHIWAGTNDNYANNRSRAQIMADHQTVYDMTVDEGFTPIFGTMLRRAGGTAGQETVRLGVNEDLAAKGWYLTNFADHPAFLSTANVAETAPGFRDGIHPTETANTDVLAPGIATVMLSVIARESVS